MNIDSTMETNAVVTPNTESGHGEPEPDNLVDQAAEA